MFEGPVVYVDIETSGGSYRTSRIIEVAAIRVENGKIVDEFNTLVNPNRLISPWITNITGITNADLAPAPLFEDVAERLMQILDGAIFIAHSVRFDYSFIKNQLDALGYTFEPKLLCTVRLSRKLYTGVKGHSLEKIINRHQIEVASRHRAYDDAKAIWEFSKIAFNEHGAELFSEAVNHQLKSQTLPPNLKINYEDSEYQGPGVYIFKDKNQTPLYIGKSVNVRSRILSHFREDKKLNKEMSISLNTFNVEVIKTDTELEALLLESQLVKEHLPIYNVRLRRAKSQFMLYRSSDDNGYFKLHIEAADISKIDNFEDIYGIYTHKSSARANLEVLTRTFDLCPKLNGLENAAKSCFRYQLGKCKGACICKEDPEKYNARVEAALGEASVAAWPYQTQVALRVSETKYLLVDKWIVVGYLNIKGEEMVKAENLEPDFDLDTYKILKSFINSGKVIVNPLQN